MQCLVSFVVRINCFDTEVFYYFILVYNGEISYLLFCRILLLGDQISKLLIIYFQRARHMRSFSTIRFGFKVGYMRISVEGKVFVTSGIKITINF